MTTGETSEHRAPFMVWLGPPILLAVLGLTFFSSTGRDDSYITYWAADAFARFGEIVNYSGDRVEQCSSLAHLLLLAGLRRLFPIAMPTLAPLVSIAAGMGAVWMTGRLAAASGTRRVIGAALIAATWPGMIYWSFSGLETSLTALLVVLTVLAYAKWLDAGRERSIAWPALVTLGFLLVRPEAVIVLCALIGGLGCIVLLDVRQRSHSAVRGSERVRRWLVLVVLAAVTAGAIVLCRVLYFGSPFPQPVAAKAHGLSWQSLWEGLAYVRRHTLNHYGALTWTATAAGVLVILRDASAGVRSWVAVLSGALVIAYVMFAVATGGDWMELGRFLVPVTPLMAVLAVLGIDGVLPKRVGSVTVVALVLIQLGGLYRAAATRSYGMPVWRAAAHERAATYPQLSFFEYANRLRDRDAPVADRLEAILASLRSTGHQPVTILTGQAGFVPYKLGAHYGHFRLFDRYGLVSREFTDCAETGLSARGPMGLGLSLETLLQRSDLFKTCTGIAQPDVIFDIGSDDPTLLQLLRTHGYTVVFEQDGHAVDSAAWLPGAVVYRDAFIAVRQELSGLLPER